MSGLLRKITSKLGCEVGFQEKNLIMTFSEAKIQVRIIIFKCVLFHL